MKLVVAQALAGTLLISGVSFAIADTIVISPDQEEVIHHYVIEHKTAPVTLPSDVQVEVGTILPGTVELQTLDVPDMKTRYDYVVVDGKTVLVDPDTRKVVKVIQ